MYRHICACVRVCVCVCVPVIWNAYYSEFIFVLITPKVITADILFDHGGIAMTKGRSNLLSITLFIFILVETHVVGHVCIFFLPSKARLVRMYTRVSMRNIASCEYLWHIVLHE